MIIVYIWMCDYVLIGTTTNDFFCCSKINYVLIVDTLFITKIKNRINELMEFWLGCEKRKKLLLLLTTKLEI